MKTRHWAAWIAGGLIGAVGCTGSVTPGDVGGSGASTGAGGGYASGSTTTGTTGTSSGCSSQEPQNHRPETVPCPPSTPTPETPAVACQTDADCPPAGPGKTMNGHCDASMLCDYNACAADTDCPGEYVCGCQGKNGGGGFGGPPVGSTCIEGDCRVDGDCGANGYCSPTVESGCGAEYGVVGYYCHTCQDTCVDDSDCPPMSNGPPGYCAFNPTVLHWACGYGVCSG